MNRIADYQVTSTYQDNLSKREPPDTRPDSEILIELTQRRGVTSEKNIWCFWDSGLDGLPNWCRRNVANWARLCGPSWKIHLVHNVPGKPNHALDWITPSENLLPPALLDNTMAGTYKAQHLADLLRVALIWKHGGVWLDVGVILIQDLDRLCWNRLSSRENKYEMCCAWVDQNIIGNHFIAGRKGVDFLLRWQQLFSHIWKDRTSCDGLSEHPLLQFRSQMPPSKSYERGYNFPFNVSLKTIMEYTAQITCFSRVASLQEPNGGFDGKKYWEENVLKIDALDRCWRAEKMIGFKGQDLFDILNMKRPAAHPGQKEYREAESLVWDILANASMQKVTHGKSLLSTPALGTLWDSLEREGKLDEAGTLAELLRYGSLHWQQIESETEYVEVEKMDFVIKKALLEA